MASHLPSLTLVPPLTTILTTVDDRRVGQSTDNGVGTRVTIMRKPGGGYNNVKHFSLVTDPIVRIIALSEIMFFACKPTLNKTSCV